MQSQIRHPPSVGMPSRPLLRSTRKAFSPAKQDSHKSHLHSPRIDDACWRPHHRTNSLICTAKKTSNKEQLPNKAPWSAFGQKQSKQSNTSNSTTQDENVEEFENAFRVFDWKRYAAPMTAPWDGKRAFLGMVGWAASFIGVGLVFIPLTRELAGPGGFAELTSQQKALFTLTSQIAETVVGVGVIGLAAGVFNKGEPLPDDVLRVDFRGPFRKPDGWAAWGLLGVLLAPAVVYSASVLIEAVGTQDPTARGTADAVSQILSLDLSTFASLFMTTAVLAPLLEETVFRGFLLPSLAKIMPTPAAVALSSVAFGLVHLSPRDTPQLTALGILLGFSYVRSRNLLTPMLIHGAWNGTVLSVLYALSASGVDLQELLHQTASN